MRYEIPKEKIYLSAAESDAGRRIRNACASHKAEYRWLKLDMCVSRKDPPRGIELPRVTNDADAVAAIRKLLSVGDLVQEVFGVLCINSRSQVVSMAVPFKGGVASAPVEIATMLKPVLLTPACVAFMIFHNHPSGDPTPSTDDVIITQKISEAAKLMGLRLLDHLVIAHDSHISFNAQGILPR